MKDCVIIVGSAFRDESNFDFIKNSKEDHVDIISIDYIGNVLLEDTNENINGKNFNIYRRNIDMRDLENLNKLKDLLKEKGPYEKIIILDSIHFDKKGAVDYFKGDFMSSSLADDCIFEYKKFYLLCLLFHFYIFYTIFYPQSHYLSCFKLNSVETV